MNRERVRRGRRGDGDGEGKRRWPRDVFAHADKLAADDTAALAHALGLVLDAQGLLGGPRLKRGAVVIEDGVVKSVVVEENPGEITTSHADAVLKAL